MRRGERFLTTMGVVCLIAAVAALERGDAAFARTGFVAAAAMVVFGVWGAWRRRT